MLPVKALTIAIPPIPMKPPLRNETRTNSLSEDDLPKYAIAVLLLLPRTLTLNPNFVLANTQAMTTALAIERGNVPLIP